MNNLNASSSVSQKSQDTSLNSWGNPFQQLGPASASEGSQPRPQSGVWLETEKQQDPHERRISKPTNLKLLNP